MTAAKLHTNNMLSINGRTVGQLMSVTENGAVQTATAHRLQTKAHFRPLVGRLLGDAVQFDMPVYVSASPSDHRLNSALVDVIRGIVEK